MGKLLNMAILMQVQNPPVDVTYTPSPFSRAVRVTLSTTLGFNKTFIVDWEGLDASSNPIFGSVSVTVTAGSTTGTSANQIAVGESFTRISIQTPTADSGYNYVYGGDWTP